MDSPVCEADSNSRLIGLLPVLFSVVILFMTNDTKDKDNEKPWPSLIGKDLSSQMNCTNVTRVLKAKELGPQIFPPAHLNLARASRDPGGDVVVEILTFCQLLSDAPSSLSHSSVQLISVYPANSASY